MCVCGCFCKLRSCKVTGKSVFGRLLSPSFSPEMETKPSIALGNIGELKLPVGFRFRPTDEELLGHYLKRKVLSLPPPAVVIPELDVFKTDPWNLPGDLREWRHFFGRRTKRGNPKLRRECGGARATIADSSSYWKVTGKEKKIVASGSNRVIGTRRNLAFCHGKDLNNATPQWFMHELRLLNARADAPESDFARFRNETTTHGVEKRGGEWAVYRVFQKRRDQPKPGRITTPTPTVIDFRNDQAEDLLVMALGSESDPFVPSPPPPSPCLSSSTDDDDRDEETLTAYRNYYSPS